jgi:hypothetical protein
MSDLRRVVDCRNSAELLRTIAMGCAGADAPALIKVAEYLDRLAASLERSLVVRSKAAA